MTRTEISPPLTWREKFLALRIGLAIPLVEIWLRSTSFKSCQRGLSRVARWLPPYGHASIPIDEAERMAALVGFANERYSIYPADCLTRSLLLQYQLRRLGDSAELCLGARRFTGQSEALA